jgi:hypothetical protein
LLGSDWVYSIDQARDAAGTHFWYWLSRLDREGRHAEPTSSLGVLGIRELVFLSKRHTDVLSVRVSRRVSIVFDVSADASVDSMVAPNNAILAGPPDRATLLIDNVACHYILV